METFDQFEQQALAEGRIDFDGVFAYQCVDLILQYAYNCFGIRGERGNAIDYWTNTSPVLLTKFNKVATQDVQRGDIVILNGLAGNSLGHVMLATGNKKPGQFEGLEQNGSTGNGSGTGGDAIRTRFVQTVRIAGVLRPEVPAAPPAPAPAPPVPTSAEGTYNVVHDVPGYYTSSDAANRANAKVTVHPGNYHVFNQAHGMVNVTPVDGKAGSWINPGDNVAPPAPAVNPPNYDGNTIVIQPGWGLSNAAQAAGWSDAGLPTRWAAIAALNGSDDWQTFNAALKAGQRIAVGSPGAVPTPAPAPAAPAPQKPANVVYAKLETPLNFVTKLNPTHVWQLDFADDAHATAAYDLPADAPFVAYGKAQRTDGDKPCYFMTQADFGDADTSGIPANNRGINTVDLKDAPAATPEPSAAAAPAAQAEPAPAEDEGEKIEVKRLPPNLDVKYFYTAFLSPQKYTAVKLDQHIKELQALANEDGSLVHPDQQLIPTQSVLVAGTLGENREYYRTAKSVETGLYYAIPKADLVREDDITDDELDDLLQHADEFMASIGKETSHAKAQVGGFFSRLFHLNKNTKGTK